MIEREEEVARVRRKHFSRRRIRQVWKADRSRCIEVRGPVGLDRDDDWELQALRQWTRQTVWGNGSDADHAAGRAVVADEAAGGHGEPDLLECRGKDRVGHPNKL